MNTKAIVLYFIRRTLYRAGFSLAEVAHLTGRVSRQAVQQQLSKYGEPLRRAGGRPGLRAWQRGDRRDRERIAAELAPLVGRQRALDTAGLQTSDLRAGKAFQSTFGRKAQGGRWLAIVDLWNAGQHDRRQIAQALHTSLAIVHTCIWRGKKRGITTREI